jgi:hypothetical protein
MANGLSSVISGWELISGADKVKTQTATLRTGYIRASFYFHCCRFLVRYFIIYLILNIMGSIHGYRYVHDEGQIVLRTQRTQLAQFFSSILNLQTDRAELKLTSIRSFWET